MRHGLIQGGQRGQLPPPQNLQRGEKRVKKRIIWKKWEMGISKMLRPFLNLSISVIWCGGGGKNVCIIYALWAKTISPPPLPQCHEFAPTAWFLNRPPWQSKQVHSPSLLSLDMMLKSSLCWSRGCSTMEMISILIG